MKLYMIRAKTNEGIIYDKGYTSSEYAAEVAKLRYEDWNIVEKESSYVCILTYTRIGDSVEQGIVEVYDNLEACHSHMLERYRHVAEESSTAVTEAWIEDTQAYCRTESCSARWNIIVSDTVPAGCRKVKHLYRVMESQSYL